MYSSLLLCLLLVSACNSQYFTWSSKFYKDWVNGGRGGSAFEKKMTLSELQRLQETGLLTKPFLQLLTNSLKENETTPAHNSSSHDMTTLTAAVAAAAI